MLETLTSEQKRQLLEQKSNQPKAESPISLLTSLRTDPNLANLQKLRVSLSHATETYLTQFFNANGLQTLLEIVNSICRKTGFLDLIPSVNHFSDISFYTSFL